MTFEPLTFTTNGPGCVLLTTVTSVFEARPIAANRVFRPRPALTLTTLTVSPAPTIDSGLTCLSSIYNSPGCLAPHFATTSSFRPSEASGEIYPDSHILSL